MLSSLLACVCGRRGKPSSPPLISDKPAFWAHPSAVERPLHKEEEKQPSDRTVVLRVAKAAVARAVAKGKRLVHARNERLPRRRAGPPGRVSEIISRRIPWWHSSFENPPTGAPPVLKDADEEEGSEEDAGDDATAAAIVREVLDAAVGDAAALLRAREEAGAAAREPDDLDDLDESEDDEGWVSVAPVGEETM